MSIEGFGSRLRAERLKRNLSVAEVAKAIGVTTNTMYVYEEEGRIPREEVKLKLAEFYETTISALFFDE